MAPRRGESAAEAAGALFAALATEVEALPGATALANTRVEYLLANAAWLAPGAGPGRETLDATVAWYGARGLPAAWVRSVVREGRTPGRGDGSAATDRFALWALADAPRNPAAAGAPAEGVPTGVTVEQIGWAHTRPFGEIVAAAFARPELAVPVAADLTRALQADPTLRAFLVYAPRDPQGGPVGGALAYPHAAYLAGFVLGGERAALRRRLVEDARDAALSPLLVAPLAPNESGRDDRRPLAVLERRWTPAG